MHCYTKYFCELPCNSLSWVTNVANPKSESLMSMLSSKRIFSGCKKFIKYDHGAVNYSRLVLSLYLNISVNYIFVVYKIDSLKKLLHNLSKDITGLFQLSSNLKEKLFVVISEMAF